QVDRDNRLDRTAGAPIHQTAITALAVAGEEAFDRAGHQIECRFVDVAKDRARVQARDDAGGREERERRSDDLVAWPDSERHQREKERVRSGGDADREACLRILRDSCLERLHPRAENELLTVAYLADRAFDLVA